MQMARARTRVRTDSIERGGWLLGLTAVFFLMAVMLSGCNTARGMGEDSSAAGHAIAAPFKDDDAAPSG
jgi:predicted small secreted protein